MKMMFGAAAAALMYVGLSQAALAQSAAPSTCPPVPAAPAVPDGATAKAGAMTLASRAFTTWSTAAKAALECQRAAVEALKSNTNVATYLDAATKLKALQDSPEVKNYSDQVAAYNEAATKANAASEAWAASADAYNAKTKKN
jgi:hypothetical protein